MNKFCTLFLCSVLPFSTQAQEDVPLEELVKLSFQELLDVEIFTTSKSEEMLNDTPGVVTVISAKEIKQFGANNLYEVLARVTSTYMTGSHVYPQNVTAMRGDLTSHYDNHILLLLNGRPIRESFTGGINFPIYLAFPLKVIERIEVVRGPGSVLLYGSNAYSGVINIITHQKSSIPQTQVSLRAGSWGTHALETNAATNQGGFNFLAGAKFFKEKGWPFEAIDEKDKLGHTPFGEDNLGVYGFVGYQGWKLNTFLTKSSQDIWGSSPTWIKEQQSTKNEHTFVDLGYEHLFSKQWKMQLNMTYNRSITDTNSFFNNNNTIIHMPTEDVLLEMTHFLERERWNLLLGGTTYILAGESVVNDSQGQFMSSGIKKSRNTWYNLYAQGRYRLSSFSLLLGGQLIKPTDLKWNVIPRIGAVYQFSSETGIKAIYNQSFRSAFPFESTSNHSSSARNVPTLEPETVDTFDVQLFHKREKYQVAATYFIDRQEDLIARVSRPGIGNVYLNRGEVRSRGFELEGQIIPNDRWLITGSLSYQTNESEGKKNYTMVPNWMAKGGISYEFDPGSSIGIFNSFFSPARDIRMKYPNVKYVNPEPEAFHLLTLNVRTNLKKWTLWPLTLETYVYNLLDEEIYAAEFNRGRINSLPAKQGRGIYVGIEYSYP